MYQKFKIKIYLAWLGFFIVTFQLNIKAQETLFSNNETKMVLKCYKIGIIAVDESNKFIENCKAEFWIQGLTPSLPKSSIPKDTLYYKINETRLARWVLTVWNKDKYKQIVDLTINKDTTYIVKFDNSKNNDSIFISNSETPEETQLQPATRKKIAISSGSSLDCYCNTDTCVRYKMQLKMGNDLKAKKIPIGFKAQFWLEGTVYCEIVDVPTSGKLDFLINKSKNETWHLCVWRYAENGPLFANRFYETSPITKNRNFTFILNNCQN